MGALLITPCQTPTQLHRLYQGKTFFFFIFIILNLISKIVREVQRNSLWIFIENDFILWRIYSELTYSFYVESINHDVFLGNVKKFICILHFQHKTSFSFKHDIHKFDDRDVSVYIHNFRYIWRMLQTFIFWGCNLLY